MAIDESRRQELIRLASSSNTRQHKFSPKEPCDWRAQSTLDPRNGEYFTNVGAWNFIVEQLQKLTCEKIEEIILEKPQGKKGFVIKVPGYHPESTLYIKLQVGSGVVIARSFHESDYPEPKC